MKQQLVYTYPMGRGHRVLHRKEGDHPTTTRT